MSDMVERLRSLPREPHVFDSAFAIVAGADLSEPGLMEFQPPISTFFGRVAKIMVIDDLKLFLGGTSVFFVQLSHPWKLADVESAAAAYMREVTCGSEHGLMVRRLPPLSSFDASTPTWRHPWSQLEGMLFLLFDSVSLISPLAFHAWRFVSARYPSCS